MEAICKGCGNEIDPTMCWCGTDERDHNWYYNPHCFVPIGCDCYRTKKRNIVVEDVLSRDPCEEMTPRKD